MDSTYRLRAVYVYNVSFHQLSKPIFYAAILVHGVVHSLQESPVEGD